MHTILENYAYHFKILIPIQEIKTALANLDAEAEYISRDDPAVARVIV